MSDLEAKQIYECIKKSNSLTKPASSKIPFNFKLWMKWLLGVELTLTDVNIFKMN